MAVSAFTQSPTDRDFADINITPLVDVMLVLLIIFMVAAPTLTKSVEFNLPQDTKKKVEPPQRIQLAILADGSVTWNGAAQPFSALQSLMEVEAQRDAKRPPVLEIDASGDADYGVVTRVLAQARAARLDDIAFVQP
jgi:biopolymer transport protein ExbD